jgi:hypothetical protein
MHAPPVRIPLNFLTIDHSHVMTAIGRFSACLALLLYSATAACENGLEFYWNNNYEKVYTTAYATTDDYGGSHVPEFRGSFVARISGSHNFKLYSATYSTSELYHSSSELIFEGVSRGAAQNTWYWRTDLEKDFRYAIRFHTTDNYYYVRISIGVEFTGHAMADLNGDLIGVCERNGCRNLALSRLTWACQPPPSQSALQSTRRRTVSVSSSRSVTATASPLPTPSRSATWTVSESPQPSDSEAQTAPESPIATPSNSETPLSTATVNSPTAANAASAAKSIAMAVGVGIGGVLVLVVVVLLAFFGLRRVCRRRNSEPASWPASEPMLPQA